MAREDTTYFLRICHMNSNSNWNENENVKTVVKGGKVYMKIGNQLILVRGAPKPLSPAKKHTVNVRGPGAYFRNNPRMKKNALNVVRNTQAHQLAKARNTMNKSNYNEFTKTLLSNRYVANKLESIGKQTFKNWVAVSKNNGSIQGFAVVHNSRNGRNVNVLATRMGGGVGRLLMNHIVKNARKNGKAVVFLTSVGSAVPFYNKMGFKRESKNNAEKLVPMSLKLR